MKNLQRPFIVIPSVIFSFGLPCLVWKFTPCTETQAANEATENKQKSARKSPPKGRTTTVPLLIGTGASSVGFNTVYHERGTHHGYPLYDSGAGQVVFTNDGTQWFCGPDTSFYDSGSYYFRASGGPTGSYRVGPLGAGRAGVTLSVASTGSGGHQGKRVKFASLKKP